MVHPKILLSIYAHRVRASFFCCLVLASHCLAVSVVVPLVLMYIVLLQATPDVCTVAHSAAEASQNRACWLLQGRAAESWYPCPLWRGRPLRPDTESARCGRACFAEFPSTMFGIPPCATAAYRTTKVIPSRQHAHCVLPWGLVQRCCGPAPAALDRQCFNLLWRMPGCWMSCPCSQVREGVLLSWLTPLPRMCCWLPMSPIACLTALLICC
jgi:hypothetical protein